MKTMLISDLPVELLEEILSRVPMKSIGAVRSTCKNWNSLSKNQHFANKHIEKVAASQQENEVLVITVNYHWINVNIYDFHNKTFDRSINCIGILINQQNTDLEVLLRVFYCNGLLLWLCGLIKRRLLVWNPYWGTRRWIKNRTERRFEMFAFGYDKSCGTHKIFRLSSDGNIIIHIDIYDLSSDSWKTPDVAFHSNVIKYTEASLSLKGNTYWHAYDKESGDCFLHCFDFTRERFGPRLPLPYDLNNRGYVSLSSVNEEKLVLLLKQWGRTFEIDVWVTDNIEPDAVSWSKLFKFETLQLLYHGFVFESFLIDEEKKTVVVFDSFDRCYTKSTYIIDGESGDFREVERIGSQYTKLFNLVGCYVPSSVQI